MENGDQPSSNVLAALIRLLRRKIEAVKRLWFTPYTVTASALLQLKQFDFAAFLATLFVSNCSPSA